MLINLTGDRISNNVAPIFLRKEPAVSTAQTKINRLRLLPVARQRLFINGQSVAASDGPEMDVVSPIDGRVFTQIAAGSARDVDAAVAAARASFEGGK